MERIKGAKGSKASRKASESPAAEKGRAETPASGGGPGAGTERSSGPRAGRKPSPTSSYASSGPSCPLPGPDFRSLERFIGMQSPPGVVCVEYIWITRMSTAFVPGNMMRSKTRVLYTPAGKAPTKAEDIPVWGADGLSVAQGDDWTFGQPASYGRLPYTVHMVLRPVRVCTDPFRGAPHLLALCEAVFDDGSAPASNHRARARSALAFGDKREPNSEPWWAFEQEYTLYADYQRSVPLGFEEGLQKEYLNYCGVGADAVGRRVQEAHLTACLSAGLHVSGTNLEVLVGSCEYQIGPCVGIDAGDQLWLSRYILARVAEEAGVYVSFNPKPMDKHDGCGLHSNFSTAAMRAPGGWDAIVLAMGKFAARHRHHLAAYGPGNEKRLTGGEEYSSLSEFSWGVGDRGASVRVAFEAAPHRDGCGYLEDRRPGSNADPYLVILQMAITLWGPWQDRARTKAGITPLQPLSRMDIALAHKRLSSEDVQHAKRVAEAQRGRVGRTSGARAGGRAGQRTALPRITMTQGEGQQVATSTSESSGAHAELVTDEASVTSSSSEQPRAEMPTDSGPVYRPTARKLLRGPWGTRRALSLAARLPAQVPLDSIGVSSPDMGSSEDEESSDRSLSDDEEDEDDEDEDEDEDEEEEDEATPQGPLTDRTGKDSVTATAGTGGSRGAQAQGQSSRARANRADRPRGPSIDSRSDSSMGGGHVRSGTETAARVVNRSQYGQYGQWRTMTPTAKGRRGLKLPWIGIPVPPLPPPRMGSAALPASRSLSHGHLQVGLQGGGQRTAEDGGSPHDTGTMMDMADLEGTSSTAGALGSSGSANLAGYGVDNIAESFRQAALDTATSLTGNTPYEA